MDEKSMTTSSVTAVVSDENGSIDADGSTVYVISHCLLNPAARLSGLKDPPRFDTSGRKIVQLPCPETIWFGTHRREITKDQLDHPAYRRFCRRLFLPYADMLETFYRDGYNIVFYGVPKSPSCACLLTSVGGIGGKDRKDCPFENKTVPGKGVFFEELENTLHERGVTFRFTDA